MSETIFSFNPALAEHPYANAFYVNHAERFWSSDVEAGSKYSSVDVTAWCAEEFGLPDVASRHWVDRGIARTVVYFRDSVDAMAFAMRWC